MLFKIWDKTPILNTILTQRRFYIFTSFQSDVVLSVKSIRYRSTVFQRRFSLSRNNEKFGATFSVASSYRFVSLVSKRKLVVFARKGVNFSYSIYCSQWFLLRLLSIWGLGASKINFRKGHFYDSEEASLSLYCFDTPATLIVSNVAKLLANSFYKKEFDKDVALCILKQRKWL